MIAPLVGRPDSFLFADVQGKGGERSTWLGSAALGFRQDYHEARILGAYLFADRSVACNNQVYWDISPGIESMGKNWDFRANGYFPVGAKTHLVGDFFAAQMGDFEFVEHGQHKEFDRLFQVFNSTGNGADGEVGRVIPGTQHVRFYLGGYYFAPKDAKSIQGASARLTLPINHHFAIEGRDTYDNLNHNTALIDLRMTLGGISDDQSSRDVDTRIMDPIERNLATQNTGSGLPVVKSETVLVNEKLFKDNIYFFTSSGGTPFNPAAGTHNCTAEQPCDNPSFNQATVNDINSFAPDANLYFNPGTYTHLNGLLVVNSGQSLFGRSVGYSSPAVGDERAMMLGQFQLQSDTLLDSLQVLNDPTNLQPQGVLLNNASGVVLNNVLVGALNGSQSYSTGILLEGSNSDAITLNQSNVNAFVQGDFLEAIGIAESFGTGNEIITMNNSTIDANATGFVTQTYGIQSFSQSSLITLNSSAINVNGTATPGGTPSAFVEGISAGTLNNNIAILNNSIINAAAQGASSGGPAVSAEANGIDINSRNASTTTVLTNSKINANAMGGTGLGNGVIANGIIVFSNNNSIILNNSTISVNAISPGIGGGSTATVFGISEGPLFFSSNANNHIMISNSTINTSAISNGFGNATSIAIYMNAGGIGGTNTADIADSILNSQATVANATAQATANNIYLQAPSPAQDFLSTVNISLLTSAVGGTSPDQQMIVQSTAPPPTLVLTNIKSEIDKLTDLTKDGGWA